MLPERKPDSHKGDNGKVLIVGGNEIFHGAPIMAALGAEKTGIDLVFLIVPVNQQNLARHFSLNLIVDTFSGKFLRPRDVEKILAWSKKADVMVIGNGLGEKPQTLRAIRKIIEKSTCDLVLDAAALMAFADLFCHPEPVRLPRTKLRDRSGQASPRDLALTPHLGELSRMLNRKLDHPSPAELEKLIKEKAKAWGVTLVVKTPKAFIASPSGDFHINDTGDPIMTKGGTGDVLAGIIAGFMAQHLPAFEAAKEACFQWGKVGEEVAKKIGTMSTSEDLLKYFKILSK